VQILSNGLLFITGPEHENGISHNDVIFGLTYFSEILNICSLSRCPLR
jgi:hypothetical protein